MIETPAMMPDAIGTTAVQSLVDGPGTEPLTRVNSDILVVVHGVVKSFQMEFGRMVLLGSGQIKSHHSPVFPGHSQTRQFQGISWFNSANASDNNSCADACFFFGPG